MPSRAPKALECWHCRTYDRELRRCKVGKINPPTKRLSIEVAQILGAQALCVHNPYRDMLLLRMHMPRRRFLWTDTCAPAASPVQLEVEILEDPIAPETGRQGVRIGR